MRTFVAVLGGMLALGLAGPALAQSGNATSEVGYASGALGVSALLQGDNARAEAQLASMTGVKSNDPARLLNLGEVYRRTGRIASAAAAFRAARDYAHPFDVELADGTVMSTRQVAEIALARLGGQYAQQ